MKIFVIILLSLYTTIVMGKEVPQVNKTINDYTGLISQAEKDSIDQEIRSYFKETTNQLGVLVIDSLEGDNLEDFSQRVFEKWKLGDAKKDNGVLLLFAVKDHKFRIQTGQGLEGNLTDVESHRIQDQIKPYLRNNQYGKAILEEVRLVKSKIEQNAQKEIQATAVSTASGSDTTVATPVDNTPTDWSVFVYIFDAIILLVAVGVTVRHQGYKQSIKKTKELITDGQEKIKKATADAKKFGEQQKELRSRYQGSDHMKEDQLKSELSSVSSQYEEKQKSISQLESIAKKYGVKL